MTTNPLQQRSGFALILALLVVSVIISIGLSLYDLSIKQIRLSTNMKESELAFQATNAGLECARYVRRVNEAEMEVGAAITADCFGGSVAVNATIDPASVADAAAYWYEYNFTWGTAPDQRCTRVQTLVASTSATAGAGVAVNVAAVMLGYPYPDKTCDPGYRCTITSVRGYNGACTASMPYGTMEREVMVEY